MIALRKYFDATSNTERMYLFAADLDPSESMKRVVYRAVNPHDTFSGVVVETANAGLRHSATDFLPSQRSIRCVAFSMVMHVLESTVAVAGPYCVSPTYRTPIELPGYICGRMFVIGHTLVKIVVPTLTNGGSGS